MSITEKDIELLETIKSHLKANYDITRFLRDATQGLKTRQKNREKARKYWKKKYEEEEGIVGNTETNPQTEPEEPKKEEVQEEKPRRPSLLNLAEIQAKFQQGLKEGKELTLPPLITDTKAKKK